VPLNDTSNIPDVNSETECICANSDTCPARDDIGEHLGFHFFIYRTVKHSDDCARGDTVYREGQAAKESFKEDLRAVDVIVEDESFGKLQKILNSGGNEIDERLNVVSIDRGHDYVDIASSDTDSESNCPRLEATYFMDVGSNVGSEGCRETNKRNIDKRRSNVADVAIRDAKSLPFPNEMTLIDSDSNEVFHQGAFVRLQCCLTEMALAFEQLLWAGYTIW
jgi:hypothetical protein